MKVKKYRAPDRSTALKQIRDELGPQAMIVSEQRVRGTLFGLLGSSQVEILAAIEDEHLDSQPASVPASPASPASPALPPSIPSGSVAERVVAGSSVPGAEMAISPAARQAAAAAAPGAESRVAPRRGGSAPPLQPGGLSDEGTSKLAAILETFPKNGQPIPAAMAASLADLISRAAAGEEVSPPSAATGARNAGAAPNGVSQTTSASTPSTPGAPSGPSAPSTSRGPSGSAGANGTSGTSSAPASRAHQAPQAPPPTARPANGSAQHAVPPDSMGAVQQSLAELQTAVMRLTQQQQDAQMPHEAPAVRVAYQQLIQQEVEPGLALDLAGQLSDEIGMDIYVDQALVNARATALIAQRLSASSIRLPDTPESVTRTAPPAVVVLVGPTGVGKTTTLAKLASYYAFTLGKKVALVTTDTFRIAAAAQLGTYAEILELPLEVVYRAEEIAGAIGRHLEADVILVDTPGCGQHDLVKIHELSAFVEASIAAVPETVVLLTLSAPTKLRDLLHIRRGFGELPLHGLIFTKLDETTAFGPLISLAVRTAKPVYFLTTGQRVPNDIEPAARERLANLLFHGLPGVAGVAGAADAAAPAGATGAAAPTAAMGAASSLAAPTTLPHGTGA